MNIRTIASGLVAVMLVCAPALSRAENATCKDVYEIYTTCYEGGQAVEMQGCEYLIQALGPRLMGEEGLTGLSAALSVAMCKRGCEDGASKKKAMNLSSFRKNFCTTGLE